ncbi:flippase [Patescibacteria group bacterium]|nr:flippase [Patescibacteria group bacterium]
MKNLLAKIAYNTIIQVVSKVVTSILGLIAIAIVARYLGQTGFGEYITIITFLSFFAILSDFGLTLVATQMISELNADKNKILSNIFTFRLISTIVLLVFAVLIIFFFPYNKSIKLGVIIAATSFLFIALTQILTSLFQKKLKMERVCIAEIVGRLVLVFGIIVVVKCNFGLISILITTVCSSAINFFLLFFLSKRFVQIKLEFDFSIWITTIKKAWPLSLTIALNLIYLKADTLILSLVKTQAEVGIYGASYRAIDVLITLPFMFAGIILPVLTIKWAEKKQDDFKRVLQKSFDFMIVLAIPLIVGAQFLSKQIMVLIAGEKFIASGSVLKILIIAIGAIFIGCIFSHAIIAVNKQKCLIKAYVFAGVIALIGYLIFIPRYSYVGAAWVTIFIELFIAGATGYYVWKYTKFFPNFKMTIKSLIACSIMALTLYVLPINMNLFIVLFLSIIIYFASLAVLTNTQHTTHNT